VSYPGERVESAAMGRVAIIRKRSPQPTALSWLVFILGLPLHLIGVRSRRYARHAEAVLGALDGHAP
jgi:hypothetical protein